MTEPSSIVPDEAELNTELKNMFQDMFVRDLQQEIATLKDSVDSNGDAILSELENNCDVVNSTIDEAISLLKKRSDGIEQQLGAIKGEINKTFSQVDVCQRTLLESIQGYLAKLQEDQYKLCTNQTGRISGELSRHYDLLQDVLLKLEESKNQWNENHADVLEHFDSIAKKEEAVKAEIIPAINSQGEETKKVFMDISEQLERRMEAFQNSLLEQNRSVLAKLWVCLGVLGVLNIVTLLLTVVL